MDCCVGRSRPRPGTVSVFTSHPGWQKSPGFPYRCLKMNEAAYVSRFGETFAEAGGIRLNGPEQKNRIDIARWLGVNRRLPLIAAPHLAAKLAGRETAAKAPRH